MIRTLALTALVTLAFASSSHAGNVWVNFSGGNGAPLTVALPLPITFTVTNDTPSTSAVFVFQGVGNVLGGSVRAATGTLSYTTNGGSAISINSAGSIPLGVVTTNDLSIFKQASPSVGLNDVLLLSSGSATTTTNVTAAAPPSGLYSAIFVDVNGVQLGVGTALPGPSGDYNIDGSVDAADYTVWRDTLGSTTDLRANGDNTGASAGVVDQADYNIWIANFGMHAGSGANSYSTAAVPEPTTLLLLLVGIVTMCCWRRATVS